MAEMNEEELLKRVGKLIDQDRDSGLDMIVAILMQYEETAANDTSRDPEYKLSALHKLEEHYKDKEDYEKCAFLKKLADRIHEINKTGGPS